MRVTLGPPLMTGLYGPPSGVRIGRADSFVPHPLYPRLVSSREGAPATRRHHRARPRQPEVAIQALPRGWPFSGPDPIAPGMGGFALGKKDADGLTKKERRTLKHDAAGAQQAALNQAISQVQQIIRDLGSGALSPSAQITMPDITFTPQGKKAKKLKRKYDALVQKELPRAQSFAQKKEDLTNIPSPAPVVTTPGPDPIDEDPSYTPPPGGGGGGGTTPPPSDGFTVTPGYYDYDEPPPVTYADAPPPSTQQPPTVIVEGDEEGGLDMGKVGLAAAAVVGIGAALWFLKKKKGRR